MSFNNLLISATFHHQQRSTHFDQQDQTSKYKQLMRHHYWGILFSQSQMSAFSPSTKIFISFFLFIRLWWSPYSIKQHGCHGIGEFELSANWKVISTITQSQTISTTYSLQKMFRKFYNIVNGFSLVNLECSHRKFLSSILILC